jgi:hypothetical protein
MKQAVKHSPTVGEIVDNFEKEAIMSFKPEVFVDGQWASNGLAFATMTEAEQYAEDLYSRWTLCTAHQAVESTDPVNYKWDNETRTLTDIEDGHEHVPEVSVQL